MVLTRRTTPSRSTVTPPTSDDEGREIHAPITKAVFEQPDSKSVLVSRNLAVAIIMVFCLQTLMDAYDKTGVFFDYTMAVKQFQGFNIIIAVMINFLYIGLTVVIIPWLPTLNLVISAPFYFAWQLVLVVAPYFTLRLFIAEPSALHGASVGLEVIVIMMKCHSFFWGERDLLLQKKDNRPKFKQLYMFIMFPTLNYQRSYTRTESIRWGFCLQQVLSATWAFFMIYVVANYHFLPEGKLIAKKGLIRSMLSQSLTGLLLWVLSFFGIWHALLCLAAELTRFADRSQFYKEWWEVTHFNRFWSTWNVVTARWVREDLYYRMKASGVPKYVALVWVMLTAGLFHELALLYTFGTLTFWITAFYMTSIGVSALTSGKWIERSMLGNFFLWAFLLIGAPLVVLIHESVYETGTVPLFPAS